MMNSTQNNYTKEDAERILKSLNTTEQQVQQKVKANNNIIPQDMICKDQDLTKWLADHAMTECRARFAPYLDFRNWR